MPGEEEVRAVQDGDGGRGERNEKDKEVCELEPMHCQRAPRRRASPAHPSLGNITAAYASLSARQQLNIEEKRRNGLGAVRWEIL
jgi:hypothetical protein